MDLGIKGKRALVLASSQGLGLGIATKLCEEGASVIVSGRVEEKLAAVVEELNTQCAGNADYVVADLSARDAAEQLYSAAKEKLGGVDHELQVLDAEFIGQLIQPCFEAMAES